MLEKTKILPNETCYFYDKKTGEKFLRRSNITFCQIPHFTLESEISGEKVLLSADGIRRRFSKNPNSSSFNIRNFFQILSKLR